MCLPYAPARSHAPTQAPQTLLPIRHSVGSPALTLQLPGPYVAIGHTHVSSDHKSYNILQ